MHKRRPSRTTATAPIGTRWFNHIIFIQHQMTIIITIVVVVLCATSRHSVLRSPPLFPICGHSVDVCRYKTRYSERLWERAATNHEAAADAQLTGRPGLVKYDFWCLSNFEKKNLFLSLCDALDNEIRLQSGTLRKARGGQAEEGRQRDGKGFKKKKRRLFPL